jgi:hypothetical protein
MLPTTGVCSRNREQGSSVDRHELSRKQRYCFGNGMVSHRDHRIVTFPSSRMGALLRFECLGMFGGNKKTADLSIQTSSALRFASVHRLVR